MCAASIPTEGRTLISCQTGIDVQPALAFGFADVDVVTGDDPFDVRAQPHHDRVVFVVAPGVALTGEAVSAVGAPTFIVASRQTEREADEAARIAALEVQQDDLKRENARLTRELDKTVAERADAADVRRRYDALRKSTLGRATVRYWELRRQFKRRSA